MRFCDSLARIASSGPGGPGHHLLVSLPRCRSLGLCMQFQARNPARNSAVFHAKKRARLHHLSAVEEGMFLAKFTVQ